MVVLLINMGVSSENDHYSLSTTIQTLQGSVSTFIRENESSTKQKSRIVGKLEYR